MLKLMTIYKAFREKVKRKKERKKKSNENKTIATLREGFILKFLFRLSNNDIVNIKHITRLNIEKSFYVRKQNSKRKEWMKWIDINQKLKVSIKKLVWIHSKRITRPNI